MKIQKLEEIGPKIGHLKARISFLQFVGGLACISELRTLWQGNKFQSNFCDISNFKIFNHRLTKETGLSITFILFMAYFW